MKESDTGRRPAEVYEQLFVPALFRQWGKVVTEAAAIGLGHRVLDVACGTGVLARAAAERVGPDGMVVGLDASEEMLAVAGARAPASNGTRDKPRRSPLPTRVLTRLSASSA
jgi:ubiquinone/menaquinone biosynthesis C-methylase UbiE